jgi:hypothetical protein
MCTVTAVPRVGLSQPAWSADPLLLRLVSNRDERNTRAEALPPVVQTIERRRVLMPLDPESGGSWIAANDSGLVFALLNVTRVEGAAVEGLSRGGVIPRLAGAGSLTEALTRLHDMDAGSYRPYRLLMFDASQLVECWLEAERVRYRRAYLQGPVMRTSSSLGDALVEGPRRTLFRRFFRGTPNAAAAQDGFHEHQWPGREHVSVRMRRADAATVSRTTVEVSAGFVTMIYTDERLDRRARAVLPLSASPVARRCS